MASISRLRPALGTFVGFEAHAPTPSQALAAIDAATTVIARLDALLHPNRADSDLAAIARAALGDPIRVHSWTFQILTLCRSLHHASDGAFDPCLPDAVGCMSDLELLAPDRIVTRAAVQIDLGGIAKGFAVDQAIETMRDAGCSSALVNAGGDIRASGEHGFPIVCRHASGGSQDLVLRDLALAVSHRASDGAPAEHRGYYLRGASTPSTTATSVAILAPTAALADALTKCAMLCSADTADDLLRRFGATRLA